MTLSPALNKPLGFISQETFPLPKLHLALREISFELHHGHGFKVLRGLPVGNHTREENIIIYAGVSSHIASVRGRQDNNFEGKPADVAKHWKDFAYPCPGLFDPKHQLVKKAGATVTPESALFDSKGSLVYRGRINDLYMDFGKPRYAPTVHDLKRSLDAVLAGKPVPIKTTKVIGCTIYNPP